MIRRQLLKLLAVEREGEARMRWIRIYHVGDEHVASLHAIHLARRGDQANLALPDFLSDGATAGQYC